jgi:hypothetical protein
MDFNKLEQLKKIKKLSYEELAEMVGMSKNGLNGAIRFNRKFVTGANH